jgi:hypothetical protein
MSRTSPSPSGDWVGLTPLSGHRQRGSKPEGGRSRRSSRRGDQVGHRLGSSRRGGRPGRGRTSPCRGHARCDRAYRTAHDRSPAPGWQPRRGQGSARAARGPGRSCAGGGDPTIGGDTLRGVARDRAAPIGTRRRERHRLEGGSPVDRPPSSVTSRAGHTPQLIEPHTEPDRGLATRRPADQGA